MLTLSYGYKLPVTGDYGATWFPALEHNISALNDHTHDGATSARLTAASIIGVSQTITSGSWSATSGGTYRQLVTTPASVTFDDYSRSYVINSGSASGHRVYLSEEKVSNTTFYVYCNDNAIDIKILHLV
jgi:hypothetical protein